MKVEVSVLKGHFKLKFVLLRDTRTGYVANMSRAVMTCTAAYITCVYFSAHPPTHPPTHWTFPSYYPGMFVYCWAVWAQICAIIIHNPNVFLSVIILYVSLLHW